MFYLMMGIIYISIGILDLGLIPYILPVSWLKFSSIVLCFLYLLKNRNTYPTLSICIGGLLVIADYFLVLTTNYLLGVCIFCYVQLLYI